MSNSNILYSDITPITNYFNAAEFSEFYLILEQFSTKSSEVQPYVISGRGGVID